MKKFFSFVLALVVGLCVVGCDKKTTQQASEIVEDPLFIENVTTEIKSEDKEEQYETKADGNIKSQNNNLNDENLLIENQLDNYEKWFSLSHPESASEDEIIEGVVTTYYYDYEDKVPIEVLEIDDEKCIAKYNITTQKGNQYQYDLLMEKIYKDTTVSYDRDKYYTTEVNLIANYAENNNVPEYFFSEVIYNDDSDRDMLLKLFEYYETLEYNSLNNKKTFHALEYIKIDITGSDYNEYLVIFGEPNVHYGSNEYCSDIYHLSCYRFEEVGAFPVRNFVCELPQYNLYHFPSDILKSNILDEVAYFFDGGVVFDFNQNGINEIYIAYTLASGWSLNDEIIMIEWNGNMFVPHIIHSPQIHNHFSEIKLSFNFDNMTLNIYEEFFVPTDDVVIGMPAAMGITGSSNYTYKWFANDDMYIMTQKILNKQSYLGD